MPIRPLSISEILPKGTTLDLSGWESIDEEWRRPIAVRATLSIPEVAALFGYNQRIKDVKDPEQLRPILEEAYEAVMTILREKNPSLPDLPLDVGMTLDIMGWLASGDGTMGDIEDVVAEVLRGGVDAEVGPEELAERLAEAASAEEEGEAAAPQAADRAPLRSKKRSRRRSTRSGSTSAGGPSGGSPAAGPPSGATSPTSASKAADAA